MRKYSVYIRGCPLLSASLFTLKFDSLSQLYFLKQWNFSVKSKALVRVQPLSYTEYFPFILRFNVALYFQLKKTLFFNLISERFLTNSGANLALSTWKNEKKYIVIWQIYSIYEGLPLPQYLAIYTKAASTFKKESYSN